MTFVKFAESARSYRPRVSVRSNGTIGFNSGSVQKFDLSSYDYAILFYDKDANRIGIRPVRAEEQGAHKLNKGKTGAWISCRRFLDFFEISVEDTKRADASWDGKEKMIVFELP